MENRRNSGTHEILLYRLQADKDRQPGPLTDPEIRKMMRQGILRSTHYLWLAEQYMMDMSKLQAGEELEQKLMELSGVCRYMEKLVDALFKQQ